MDFVTMRRKHIQWNIQQNPTLITIHRKGKIEKDGAFEAVDKTLVPITVRIFQKGKYRLSEESDLAGTKQEDISYGMLADYQADIQAGPNVKDEFDVPNLGRFYIESINPQVVQGQIVGYQADLVRVK
jgi:hypothetical protein